MMQAKVMTSKLILRTLEKTFVRSTFNPDIVSRFSPELKAAIADRYTYLSDGVLYFHFESLEDMAIYSVPIFQLLVLEIRSNLDLAKLINAAHFGCLEDRWEIRIAKNQACSPP